MAKGLDQIKLDLVRAYQAGDAAKLKAVIGEYSKAKAALGRSQANIAADAAKLGPDVSGNQFLPGAGYGMTKVAGQLAQLVTPKSLEKRLDTSLIPVSDEARAEAEKRAEALRSTRSGKIGQFVGETVATAPVAGVAGGAVRGGLIKAGTALAPEGATMRALIELTKLPRYARYGGWAAEGAAGQAATTGEVTPGGVVAGMAGGRAGDALGTLLNAVARGLKKTPGAETLMEYGADLTPGPLNPRGMLNRLERTAEVSPILGQAVRQAREKATERVIPELISDIAEVKPRESVSEAAIATQRKLNALYGKPKPISKPKAADLAEFKAEVMESLRRNAPPDLDEVNAQLTSTWSRIASARDTGAVKLALSDLKAKSRSLKSSGDGSKLETARVYDDAAKWIDSYYKRGFSPTRRARIERADKIYSEYRPIEDAAAGSAAAARPSPTGIELLKQLADVQAPGPFVRRENIGRTRRVAEALAEHEKGLSAEGGIERTPWLRQLLAMVLVGPALFAQSPVVRRFAQGKLAPQRALQTGLEATIPGTRASVADLLEALYKVRAGAAGAATDELNKVKY